MIDLLKVGFLILAAGDSSRMGRPKQLLEYNGKTLIEHTLEAANEINDRILVILGGNHRLVETKLKTEGINIRYNANWEEGLGSSVRMGLNELLMEYPDLDAVILCVCDQPFISGSLFKLMINSVDIQQDRSIVASAYAQTLGVPVLFSKFYFEDLITLRGKEGAKVLLAKYKEQVISVRFDNGAVDIDTPEDYRDLIAYAEEK